jgi:hypothetical protein
MTTTTPLAAAAAPRRHRRPAAASMVMLLLLLLALFALASQPAAASGKGSQGDNDNHPPRRHPPPKKIHGDAADVARRVAKRDAFLSRKALRDSEKLAVKALKSCLDKNPGCVECIPTFAVPGLYVCATRELGDAACAWPSWVANPASDGIVNACTCNDGFGSTKLSFKKWTKEREHFVGSDKFLCVQACGGGGGATNCASPYFNAGSCVCVV